MNKPNTRWSDIANDLDKRPGLACVLVFLCGVSKLSTLISPFFLPLTLFSFLGLAYASLVTLKGRYGLGLLLFSLIILPVDGFSYFILHNKSTNDPLTLHAGNLALFSALGTLLAYAGTVIFSKRNDFGAWLEVMALVLALFIAILHSLYPNISEYWATELLKIQTWNTKAADISAQGGGLTEVELQAIQMIKPYMTGILASCVLLSNLFLMGFARAWQSRLDETILFKQEITNIRLQYLTAILFLGALIANYYNNRAAQDLLPILVLIFFISGFSFIHFLYHKWENPNKIFWMVFFYFLIALLAGVSIKFLAGLGLMDVFLNFRKSHLEKNN